MATDVDTDGLRRLASRIEEVAPQDPPLDPALSGEAVGHDRLASAIGNHDRTGADAVRKLHADAPCAGRGRARRRRRSTRRSGGGVRACASCAAS